MSSQSPGLLRQFAAELAELTGRAAPATLAIDTGRCQISGFLWQPDMVVTAAEPLEDAGAQDLCITSSSGSTSGRIVGMDLTTDVALVKLGTPIDVVRLVPDAGAVPAVCDVAVVVGRSRDGVSCAAGTVTLAGEAWESLRGGRIDRRIRLDNNLERHQEGGPVLDADGRCIGMAVLAPQRRAIVIPSATIVRVAAELLEHGRVKRGYFGVAGQRVRVEPVGADGVDGDQPKGLLVVRLDRKGPAWLAGLRQGDIVTRIDGRGVSSPRGLRRMLGPDTVGRTVPCEFVRAGKAERVSVLIAEIGRG